MRREALLTTIAALAFLAAVAVLTDAPQPLRAVAGILLVLVLPGAALAAAVTHRQPWPAELLMLVTASSIAVVVLGGLLLDRLPDGLTTDSWALALAYATVVVVILAALRRPGRALLTLRLRPRPLPRPVGRQIALLATAAALAAAAVGIARAGEASARRETPVVQLWMLQAPGGQTTTLRIGVDARYAGTSLYRLEIRAGGGAPTVWQVPIDGRTEWRAIVEIPNGARQRVDALLFAEDAPGTVVRRVRQWVG